MEKIENRETEISRVLGILEENISILEKEIEETAGRLIGILRTPELENCEEESNPQFNTTLAKRISESNYRICIFSKGLKNLRNRIEL